MPLLNEIMGREDPPCALSEPRSSRKRNSRQSQAIWNPMQLTTHRAGYFYPKLARALPCPAIERYSQLPQTHDISDISHELLARCSSLITDQSVAKVNLPGGRFLRRKEKRIFVS